MIGRRQSFACLVSLASLFARHTVGADSTPLAPIPLPSVVLPSTDGERRLNDLRGYNGTVLFFFSTECPISNGYAEVVQSLAERYAKVGVRFLAVDPNSGQSLAEISAYAREYRWSLPVLKDAGGDLARELGVSVCPCVCLFDPRGELRYRGRIDDRYVRRGGPARPPRQSDLVVAIDALLDKKPIPHATTEAIGCPIMTRPMASLGRDDASSITYSRQVAAILQSRCQECHRPGGIGPFSLLTYEQAASWAEDLRVMTAEGTMPPWKPTEGFGAFQHSRRMPQSEIDVLAAWVQGGCLPGRLEEQPPPRVFPDGWKGGTPDLVLEPAEEYSLESNGEDVYRNFVLPTGLKEDMYVRGLEVMPGNRRIVHHVILYLDGNGISETLDRRDPGPGYSSSVGIPGFLPSGSLGGWAPGNSSWGLGEGIARSLPKNARVVMQVHYHKSGKPETDRTRVGLYFAKTTPKRLAVPLVVLPRNWRFGGLRIPAGASNHEVRASYIVMSDLEALNCIPHMHLLGRDCRLTATLPDGTLVPLIEIKKWDFNWQETYSFAKPVSLPKGSRIDMVMHFDNSAENPNNPNTPPREVTWGEQTTEEMAIAFFEVVPREEAKSPAELRRLNPYALFAGHFAAYGAAEAKPRAGERKPARGRGKSR